MLMQHHRDSRKHVSAFAIFLLITQTRVQAGGNQAWDDATRLYTTGNYTAALAEFRKLSDKNPTDPSTHYMLAQCYKGLNKTQQAILEFTWVSHSSDPRIKAMAVGALKQMGQNVNAAPAQSNASGPREFVNGSAAQTVTFAYKNGWVPCTGGCLTFAKPGWHHQQVQGHPDTDQWMTYTYQKDGQKGEQWYSQGHVGHIIKELNDSPAVDTGPCSICGGTGWVRYK
jgi:tetratricopeptide (TPR) repeat protein